MSSFLRVATYFQCSQFEIAKNINLGAGHLLRVKCKGTFGEEGLRLCDIFLVF